MAMPAHQMANQGWGSAPGRGMGRGMRPEQSYPSTSPQQMAAIQSDPLQDAICSLLEASKPIPDELKVLEECVDLLQNMVARLGPEWEVRPFGSAANGFATRGSDLDVTCYKASFTEQEQDSQLAIQEMKEKLLPLLRKAERFEVVEEVFNARIPIVKMRFDGKLDVDLSCHNLQALQNTYLLWAYSKLHPMVRALVIVVKLWAKMSEVCGAQLRHLSTYSLTLMCIFFLQVHHNWRLPTLPTWCFSGSGIAEQAIRFTWSNQGTINSMVIGFFRFYSAEFSWGTEVVSIRLGRRTYRTDPEFSRLSGRMAPRLHIEDPFLLGRNLNCVLGMDQESQLHTELEKTALHLGQRSVPPVLQMSPLQALYKNMDKAPRKDQDEGAMKDVEQDRAETMKLKQMYEHVDVFQMTRFQVVTWTNTADGWSMRSDHEIKEF
eukprot:TRINITY_DN79129_c0_g1_i1.p1 TRINITY_DN79129_c0_g1~~TRINITY_DN79129_c0_g1_i1.p1  ORF type:complete len:434 (-),score=66.53 TRINITY_DN79129_c0_g1_i1:179-1480(-)